MICSAVIDEFATHCFRKRWFDDNSSFNVSTVFCDSSSVIGTSLRLCVAGRAGGAFLGAAVGNPVFD